jgi:hypothetical protein
VDVVEVAAPERSKRSRSSAHILAAVDLDSFPPKEGVLVAWGFTEDGERVLLAVMLGMREPTRIGLGSGAI